MTRIRYAAVIALIALLLPSCGGGGNGSQSRGAMGTLSLTVHWPAPAKSRLIPAASNSIKATLASGSTTLGTQTITRPAQPPWDTTVTFNNLPAGAATLSASAFPSTDATGVAQATGSAPVSIVAGQTVSVAITLNSTIASLTVTPANPNVNVGATQQLTVTALDAQGNVVLVAPANVTWNSATPAAATVDTNGLVTGVAAGSSVVTVTESESGKSATTTVTVGVNPLNDPRFMTITPDGQSLYVVNEGSKAVSQFHINADGSLTPLTPANTGPLPANPLVFKIAADPQSSLPFVYVVSPDLDLVSQFRYDTTGALTPLSPPTVSVSAGDHPADVAIHPNGQFLYTADPVNQAQGTIPRLSQFRINADGTLTSLGPDVQISPGFNVNRLVVTRNGKFVYALSGIGANRGQALRAFQINADGTLALIGEFGGTTLNVFELAADPTSRFLYTANNTNAGGNVASFQINADGSLTQVGSTPPAGSNAPTSIQVTPDGKFVYVVDASDSLLFGYSVQADGSLTPLSPASVPTGRIPIEVRITPNGQFLYVCNRQDNSISRFRINSDGSLTPI